LGGGCEPAIGHSRPSELAGGGGECHCGCGAAFCNREHHGDFHVLRGFGRQADRGGRAGKSQKLRFHHAGDECRGGCAFLRADFGAAQPRDHDVPGGCSDAAIRLPDHDGLRVCDPFHLFQLCQRNRRAARGRGYPFRDAPGSFGSVADRPAVGSDRRPVLHLPVPILFVILTIDDPIKFFVGIWRFKSYR
jgi:hypothetical protein